MNELEQIIERLLRAGHINTHEAILLMKGITTHYCYLSDYGASASCSVSQQFSEPSVGPKGNINEKI